MGHAVHYRGTIIWQKAVEMVREIYSLTPRLLETEPYGMHSQITRAAVSVPANAAEGWTQESRKEKAQFFPTAHGSLSGVETLVTICEQLGRFPEAETSKLRSLVDELSRMLTTMRRNHRAN